MSLILLIITLLTVCFLQVILCQMEGFVVGGDMATIKEVPHSAFLEINCGDQWICGASIINQYFTLTAAHCTSGCDKNGSILVVVGNENKNNGIQVSGKIFKIHRHYNEETMEADIGLVKVTKPLPLGPDIQRVLLMEKAPVVRMAAVAGWGITDEQWYNNTDILKKARQKLLKKRDCVKILRVLGRGLFCGMASKIRGYAAAGDSGSALVIKGFIQIGIVSYKVPNLAENLTVYTNTSYYYPWIVKNTRRLQCG